MSKGFALEELEHRRLLSAGATLDAGGILTIEGTEHADKLLVTINADHTKLLVTGIKEYVSGEFWDWAGFYAEFDVAAVHGIQMNGLGGDDSLHVFDQERINTDWGDGVDVPAPVYGAINIPVTLNGGAGVDDLWSESVASDTFIGGPGHDRAYSLIPGDRYATESVENYRNSEYLDYPNGGGKYWAYDWFYRDTGSDQLIADPWEVPNRTGRYWGPHAPTFEDANVINPDPGEIQSNAGTSDGDEAAPVEPVKPSASDTTPPNVVVPPALVFCVQSAATVRQKPWDDGGSVTA
jgi:hypothetical protein